jgi:hypothetical protein
MPYHARARKRVPAETDTIPILDIAPLLLEGLVVCHVGLCCGLRSAGIKAGPRRRPLCQAGDGAKGRIWEQLGSNSNKIVTLLGNRAHKSAVAMVLRSCGCATSMMVKAHMGPVGGSERRYSSYGLAPAIRALHQNQVQILQPFSFLHHRQLKKHYLTATPNLSVGAVFALRVEESWPMAGRLVWKTRSGYPERLGISRGHMHS